MSHIISMTQKGTKTRLSHILSCISADLECAGWSTSFVRKLSQSEVVGSDCDPADSLADTVLRCDSERLVVEVMNGEKCLPVSVISTIYHAFSWRCKTPIHKRLRYRRRSERNLIRFARNSAQLCLCTHFWPQTPSRNGTLLTVSHRQTHRLRRWQRLWLAGILISPALASPYPCP